MLLQFGEILEGVDLVQLAGVDQTHEQVSHAGPILGLVEAGVLAMQDRLLQGLFANIVVERCSGVPEEEGQRIAMLEHVGGCLAQTAVGFELVLLYLFGQRALDLGHLRAAFGLTPPQPLFRGQPNYQRATQADADARWDGSGLLSLWRSCDRLRQEGILAKGPTQRRNGVRPSART